MDPANSNRVEQGIRVGMSVTLEAFGLLEADPPPTYQWWLNGQAITGGTNPVLVLANLQPDQTGNYSVVASNFAGSVTMDIGKITIPILTSRLTRTEEGPQFEILGEPDVGYVLQVSDDLVNWTNLLTNAPGSTPTNFIVPKVNNEPSRFYRTQPWP